MKDQVLKVEIEKGLLTISIGIDTLCDALNYSLEEYFDGEVRITDNNVFAKEVLNRFYIEEEDGSTMVHRLFEKAAYDAVEFGANGIEEVEK